MGDDQRGAAAVVLAQPVVDLRLHPGVDGGRGVVQDEHGRVADQGAGQGDALALAAGEGESLFADDGVVPLREPFDELVGAGDASGCPDLFAGGARYPVGDVGAHRVGEQQALLEDVADPGAQGGEGESADVVAAHPYRAGRYVVEAGQQGRGGGLPGAGRADQGEGLTGPDVQGEAVEERCGFSVPEGDVVPADGRGLVRQLSGVGGVGDGRRLVDDLQDPFGACPGLLPDGEEGRHLADRGDEGAEVGGEGEEGAERDPAVQGHPAAEGEDGDLAERGDRLERGVVAAGEADDAQPRGEEVAGTLFESGELALLLAEALDHADAGDGRLDGGGDLRGLLLGVPVGGEEVAAAAQRDQPEERADDERHDGQQRRQHRHEDQGEQEHQRVAREVGQELQQGLDEGDVRDGPADHLTGAQVVLLGAAEPEQGGERVVAEVVLHAEGEPAGAVAAGEARAEADGAECGEQHGPGGERGGGAGRHPVHHVPQHEGQGGGGYRGEDGGTEGEQQIGAVPQAVAQQPPRPSGRRLPGRTGFRGRTVRHRASARPMPK